MADRRVYLDETAVEVKVSHGEGFLIAIGIGTIIHENLICQMLLLFRCEQLFCARSSLANGVRMKFQSRFGMVGA